MRTWYEWTEYIYSVQSILFPVFTRGNVEGGLHLREYWLGTWPWVSETSHALFPVSACGQHQSIPPSGKMRNPANFCYRIRNPGLGNWNTATAEGIRNSINDWNPEPEFHWQRIHNPVPWILNSWHEIQNLKGAFLWDDPDLDQWSEITRIMADQMNRWILVQSGIHSWQGFIGSFDLPWSEWSPITDPDPDHPKGTHPKTVSRSLSSRFSRSVLASYPNRDDWGQVSFLSTVVVVCLLDAQSYQLLDSKGPRRNAMGGGCIPRTWAKKQALSAERTGNCLDSFSCHGVLRRQRQPRWLQQL